MRNWSEEDLVSYYYGDHPESSELAAALAASPELHGRYAEIQRVLSALPDAMPRRSAEYGEGVWRALAPRLEAGHTLFGPWRPRPAQSWWALAAALVLMVAAAYLLGRANSPGSAPVVPEALAGFPAEARQRLLLSAVAHHLEQAEVVLTGVANHGLELASDLGLERARAQDLLIANRLYRSAAGEVGEGGLVPLLGDLELLLLEIAHAPAVAADLSAIQGRLRERDLLFKVRVVETRLRHQLLPPARHPRGPNAGAATSA